MHIFTEIIILVASTLILGQIEEYDLIPEVEERTLPYELQFLFVNKTDEELQLEDCMKSYNLCMTFNRNRPTYDLGICAVSKNAGLKATFPSFCEMIYQNCKTIDVGWGYFHDGPCFVEFAPQ